VKIDESPPILSSLLSFITLGRFVDSLAFVRQTSFLSLSLASGFLDRLTVDF
jgi:hypothetical protein